MSDDEKKVVPESQDSKQRASAWVFTLQDDGEFKEEFKEIKEHKLVRYLCYQKEVGESGNAHYQGYIELNGRCRLSAMKKLNASAHFEPRRGSREQAREYCRKEESRVPGTEPIEWGIWNSKGSGARTDLAALYESVKNGDDFADIQEQHLESYAKYYKFADRARTNLKRKIMESRPFQKPTIKTYWGETGCGKTRLVHEAEPDVYTVDCGTSQTLWWDNYDGQEAILFDDFYGGVKHSILLQLIDGYKMQLQVKGGYTFKAWTRVYFTSNKHPENWYKDKRGWPALRRRLETEGSEIIKLGDQGYEYDEGLVQEPVIHVRVDEEEKWDPPTDLNKLYYGI